MMIINGLAWSDPVSLKKYLTHPHLCTMVYTVYRTKVGIMKTVTFTEFRKDASALFSAVENGETIQVIRHGKPIAEILPFKDTAGKLPSWKKKRIKKSIKGEELSSIILGDRDSLI